MTSQKVPSGARQQGTAMPQPAANTISRNGDVGKLLGYDQEGHETRSEPEMADPHQENPNLPPYGSFGQAAAQPPDGNRQYWHAEPQSDFPTAQEPQPTSDRGSASYPHRSHGPFPHDSQPDPMRGAAYPEQMHRSYQTDAAPKAVRSRSFVPFMAMFVGLLTILAAISAFMFWVDTAPLQLSNLGQISQPPVEQGNAAGEQPPGLQLPQRSLAAPRQSDDDPSAFPSGSPDLQDWNAILDIAQSQRPAASLMPADDLLAAEQREMEMRYWSALTRAADAISDLASSLDRAMARLPYGGGRNDPGRESPPVPFPVDIPDLPLEEDPPAESGPIPIAASRPAEPENEIAAIAADLPNTEDGFAISGGQTERVDASILRSAQVGNELGALGRVVKVIPYEDGSRLVIFERNAVYVD